MKTSNGLDQVARSTGWQGGRGAARTEGNLHRPRPASRNIDPRECGLNPVVTLDRPALPTRVNPPFVGGPQPLEVSLSYLDPHMHGEGD